MTIATGMVAVAGGLAARTGKDLTPQIRRAAALNRPHDMALLGRDHVGGTIGWASALKDHVERDHGRPTHRSSQILAASVRVRGERWVYSAVVCGD